MRVPAFISTSNTGVNKLYKCTTSQGLVDVSSLVPDFISWMEVSGEHLYVSVPVSGSTGNRIRKYDVATLTLQATYFLPQDVVRFTVSGDNIYYASIDTWKIMRYSMTTGIESLYLDSASDTNYSVADSWNGTPQIFDFINTPQEYFNNDEDPTGQGRPPFDIIVFGTGSVVPQYDPYPDKLKLGLLVKYADWNTPNPPILPWNLNIANIMNEPGVAASALQYSGFYDPSQNGFIFAYATGKRINYLEVNKLVSGNLVTNPSYYTDYISELDSDISRIAFLTDFTTDIAKSVFDDVMIGQSVSTPNPKEPSRQDTVGLSDAVNQDVIWSRALNDNVNLSGSFVSNFKPYSQQDNVNISETTSRNFIPISVENTIGFWTTVSYSQKSWSKILAFYKYTGPNNNDRAWVLQVNTRDITIGGSPSLKFVLEDENADLYYFNDASYYNDWAESEKDDDKLILFVDPVYFWYNKDIIQTFYIAEDMVPEDQPRITPPLQSEQRGIDAGPNTTYWNALEVSASDAINISDTATYTKQSMNKIQSHTVVFSDVVVSNVKMISIVDTINLNHVLDVRGPKYIYVSNTVLPIDGAKHNFKVQSLSNTIRVSDTHRRNIYNISVSNTISFTEDLRVQHHNSIVNQSINISDRVDFLGPRFYTQDDIIQLSDSVSNNIKVFNLSDTVTFSQTYVLTSTSVKDTIYISDRVILTRPIINISVSDIINLSDKVAKNYYLSDTITVSGQVSFGFMDNIIVNDTVEAYVGHDLTSNIHVMDQVALNRVINISVSHNVRFKQGSLYFFWNRGFNNYSPYVGGVA